MTSEETRKAYHSAVYKVFAQPEFTLRIGQESNPLKLLFATTGTDSAVFITAANPYGEIKSPEYNQEQNAQLSSVLASLGYEVIPGRGIDPQGQWPAEDSFLVLGVSEENALKLCAVWQQNAVVWAGSDGVPELLTID